MTHSRHETGHTLKKEVVRMVYLTRRVEFSAAHTLFNPQLSLEENRDCFGKCGNPLGHGHNYVLDVTLCGEIDPKTGYFINLEDLKQILDAEIVSRLDHKNINQQIDYFRERVTTCENLARWIWEQLKGKTGKGTLYRVRLFETRNNYVEYFGDEHP